MIYLSRFIEPTKTALNYSLVYNLTRHKSHMRTTERYWQKSRNHLLIFSSIYHFWYLNRIKRITVFFVSSFVCFHRPSIIFRLLMISQFIYYIVQWVFLWRERLMKIWWFPFVTSVIKNDDLYINFEVHGLSNVHPTGFCVKIFLWRTKMRGVS